MRRRGGLTRRLEDPKGEAGTETGDRSSFPTQAGGRSARAHRSINCPTLPG